MCRWVERAMTKHILHNFCLPPTAKTLLATGQYLARTNHSWPVCATIPMASPPACVLGCGHESLFYRWSSTPPKNYTFLGRLLVSQNAANVAQRYADQTRCGAPRPVGLLHRISTGTPVLCAFPPGRTGGSSGVHLLSLAGDQKDRGSPCNGTTIAVATAACPGRSALSASSKGMRSERSKRNRRGSV